jgi:hypothetical protein
MERARIKLTPEKRNSKKPGDLPNKLPDAPSNRKWKAWL